MFLTVVKLSMYFDAIQFFYFYQKISKKLKKTKMDKFYGEHALMPMVAT
jgi:hypothetical protein